MDETPFVEAVREALGFEGSRPAHFLSNEERDAALVNDLRAACACYASNDLFLASAARLSSTLTGRTLPLEMERQGEAIEKEAEQS